MERILAMSVIFLALIYCSWAENIRIKEQKILDDLLDPKKSGYDKRVRPTGTGESFTLVRVTAYIIDIPEMDDNLKDYTIMMYFRQKWRDERLKYEDKHIRKIRCAEPEKVWTPDLFFPFQLEGVKHDIVHPNQFMRISSDGEVLYTMRVSVSFICDSDLRFYPHDQQKCTVDLESFGFTSDELHLRWDSRGAVSFNDKISSGYKFRLVDLNEAFENVTLNGTDYENLKIEMLFSRNFDVYFQTVYIPSILLMILSWGSFCLDPKALIPRLSFLGLIIFFMLQLAPGFAYNILQVTAMDAWFGACFLLLLATFVEFIVVNHLTHEDEAKRSAAEQSETNDAESGNMKEEKPKDADGKDAKGNKMLQKFMKRHPTRAKRTDAVCRIVFPVLFILFNLIYWPVSHCHMKYTVEDWNDSVK